MPEWLKITLGFVAVVATYLLMFFIWGWADHTITVQEWIDEDVQEFSQRDIDWTQFDPGEDPEILMGRIREVLIAEIQILHVDPTREAMRDYEETLYNLIYTLRNNPNDRGAIVQDIFDSQGAQTRFYAVAERFTSNRLYAMRYTF